jgi:phosphatidylserine decarboxylase
MPIAGELKEMIYVPGKLFSVNQSSVLNVPGLFGLNERVICIFDTEIGKVALIAVGAMIVGSISMNWHGIVAPQKKRVIQTWRYDHQKIMLNRGDEVGHFRLGSTVILLCEKDKIQWDSQLTSNDPLQLGQVIARPY